MLFLWMIIYLMITHTIDQIKFKHQPKFLNLTNNIIINLKQKIKNWLENNNY